jgi:hypothetical protein
VNKVHTHRIRCEICGKTTTKGIIEKDRGLRDRYFCSNKCLNKKIKEQEKEIEERNNPPALLRFFYKIMRKKGIKI